MAKKKNRRKKKPDKTGHKKMMRKQFSDFFWNMVTVAVATDAGDAFDKIPQSEHIDIFMKRFGSFRIEGGENVRFTKQDIRTLKAIVNSYLKSKVLTFAEGENSINLYEYFSSGLSLLRYIQELKDDAYPEAKEVKEKFQTYVNRLENGEVPKRLMQTKSVILSWMVSSIDKGIFSFKFETVINRDKASYCRYLGGVTEPEVRHFKIDGVNRPAYRAGYMWRNCEMKWAKLKAADMGVSGTFENIMLDVYIQSHALHRMEERLDAYKLTESQVYLFSSFLNLKIVKNSKGQTLIQYGNFNEKLGYFVAEIVDGAVLIKTFLFLTNDDTPEGEKLKETVGLSKAGKKYFKIDKLSTFFNSDIEKDDTLKQMFIDAGCESLFRIQTLSEINDHKEQKTAEALLKYLEINENEEADVEAALN